MEQELHSLNTGANGDSYVDTSNGDFYTKNNGTWTKTGSIRGAQGQQGIQGIAGTQGPRGASVLSGAGAPQSSTGADGDSYVNTSNGDFYTKNNGSWTKTGSIRGPQGASGTVGSYTNSTSITVSGNQLHRAALTGDVTAAANNNTVTINNNAITGVKIANGTITADKLAANAIKNIFNTNGALTSERTINTENYNFNFTGDGKIIMGNFAHLYLPYYPNTKLFVEGSTTIVENKPLRLVGLDKGVEILFEDAGSNSSRMGHLIPYKENFTIENKSAAGDIILDAHHGKIGINTRHPEATLDVNGNVKINTLPYGNANDNIVVTDNDGNLKKLSANTFRNTALSNEVYGLHGGSVSITCNQAKIGNVYKLPEGFLMCDETNETPRRLAWFYQGVFYVPSGFNEHEKFSSGVVWRAEGGAEVITINYPNLIYRPTHGENNPLGNASYGATYNVPITGNWRLPNSFVPAYMFVRNIKIPFDTFYRIR